MDVVIDRARVERQQLFEAASVQRQVLDLPLVDQTGGGTQRRVHERSLFRHFDFLSDGSYFQCQIHYSFLTHRQRDPAPHLLLEARQLCGEFIWAYRERRQTVAAVLVADRGSHQPALGMRYANTHSGQHRSGGITHSARDGRRNLSKHGATRQCDDHQDPD